MANFEIETEIIPTVNRQEKRKVQDELEGLGTVDGGSSTASGVTGGTSDLADLQDNALTELQGIRSVLKTEIAGSITSLVAEFKVIPNEVGKSVSNQLGEKVGPEGETRGQLGFNALDERLKSLQGQLQMFDTKRFKPSLDELEQQTHLLSQIRTGVLAGNLTGGDGGGLATIVSGGVGGSILGGVGGTAGSLAGIIGGGTILGTIRDEILKRIPGGGGEETVERRGVVAQGGRALEMLKDVLEGDISGFFEKGKNFVISGMKNILDPTGLIEASIRTAWNTVADEAEGNPIDLISEATKTSIENVKNMSVDLFNDTTESIITSVTSLKDGALSLFDKATQNTVTDLVAFSFPKNFPESVTKTVNDLLDFSFPNFPESVTGPINDLKNFSFPNFSQTARNTVDSLTSFELPNFAEATGIDILDDFTSAIEGGVDITFGVGELGIDVSFDDIAQEISDVVQTEVESAFQEWLARNNLGGV